MDERNRQQMILQMIRKEKIVAIVRGIPSGLILDTGRALADGGICMMEVTFDHSGPEGITVRTYAYWRRYGSHSRGSRRGL